MKKITVGIIGCGFIGGALKRWLEEHNPAIDIVVSDPAKGYFDDLTKADIFFLSIHLPTESDGSQNTDILKKIIQNLPFKPIFIRTTILPGTSKILTEETEHEVYFMPEFLTERTAYDDFCKQPMIFTAHKDLLQKIFIGKKFLEMSSQEAEITKYVHNVFGALKVTYFNAVYELCRHLQADYNNIRQGVLLSGYINEPHTKVPGPDGKFGYGGKCFPKDVDALTEFCKKAKLDLYDLLEQVQKLNNLFRRDV